MAWTLAALSMVDAALALDVDVTVLSRYPYYASRIVVDDVPPGTDVVTTYIPLHLQQARVTFDPGSVAACTARVRAPFGHQYSEGAFVECAVDDDYASYTFTVNGTAAYEPVRFPVAACRHVSSVPGANASAAHWTCQTNAASWATLSPIDRVAACQVVGVFAFGFWILTLCFVCLCCMRYHRWHAYAPVDGRNRGSAAFRDDDGDTTGSDDDDGGTRDLEQDGLMNTKRQARPARRSRSPSPRRKRRRRETPSEATVENAR
jgi:hypothetical protein